MEEMTPMADRHSSVDLVKDSSVGGICWGGGNVFRFALFGLQLTVSAVPGRWYWYQLRTCLGSVPEGWCQRTWKWAFHQISVTLPLWQLEEEEKQHVDGAAFPQSRTWRCYLMGAWMILFSRLWCRFVAEERPRNSTVSEVMRHNTIPAAHKMMKTKK